MWVNNSRGNLKSHKESGNKMSNKLTPIRNLSGLLPSLFHDDVDWGNFFTGLFASPLINNLVENEDSYYLQLDVPGFTEKDLTIEVKNEVITISGKTSKRSINYSY